MSRSKQWIIVSAAAVTMKPNTRSAISRCSLGLAVFLVLAAGTRRDAEVVVPLASQRANVFTLNLLRQHAAGPAAPANAVLSGQGIRHGLALSYVASGGRTRGELSQACGFPTNNQELLAELADTRRQIGDIATRHRIELSMASSAWLDETWAEFRRDYLQWIEAAADASLNRVRFKDPSGAANAINQWVSDQTRGHIRQAVTASDFASRSQPGVIEEPALVLVSATYLKADWGSRFEKGSTRPRPFHTGTSTEVLVPTMHQESVLLFAENEWGKFLEMPYADPACSMYLLLPNQTVPVRQLLANLTTDQVLELKRSATAREVDVLLPRLQIASHVRAKDALMALGAPSAFDRDAADFDRMIHKKTEAFRIYISEIHHDAWLELDEEGTEAAAATSTVHYSVGCSAPAHPRLAEFHADHPFVYLIVHNPSRSILFAGWVSDPGASPGHRPADVRPVQ